jgi:hypothetical protein
MAEIMDQKEFEAVTRQKLEDLSSLVAEYDQQERESELGQFSGYDPQL